MRRRIGRNAAGPACAMSTPSNRIFSGIRPMDAQQQPPERRFAATGFTDHAKRLAASQRKNRGHPPHAPQAASRTARPAIGKCFFKFSTISSGAVSACTGAETSRTLAGLRIAGSVSPAPVTQQRVRRPAAISVSSGCVAQMSRTNGQRGANRQPGGKASGSGGEPSIVVRCRLPPVSMRGTAFSSAPGVRMARIGEHALGIALFDDLAGIHDEHARTHTGDDAEIMADQHDRKCRNSRSARAADRGSAPGW